MCVLVLASKLLELTWSTTLQQLMSQSEPIKEILSSLSSQIYDPLGIISPVSVQLKIFAQKLCEAKLDWDEAISGELVVERSKKQHL